MKTPLKMIAPDRVLIVPKPPEEKTESGLIIPVQARERQQIGNVLMAGEGSQEEPMKYKVGDEVLYGINAGTRILLNDVEYLLVKQSEILGAL